VKLNKIKLKWKVFAFLLGFCALLLIVLWMFQIVFLDSFYKRIKIMEIGRNAVIIANNADNENIDELIKDISERDNITINIISLDANDLPRASSRPQSRRATEETTALIKKARESNGETYEYISPAPNTPRLNANIPRPEIDRMPRRNLPGPALRRTPMQSLIYVKLANNSLNDPFAVVIRAVISPVDATVTTLRYQLYAVSFIVLFLALILAIIIANRISKPIEEISQSALLLAKGNYNTRFKGKGFREIAALSETLNTAALELGRVEKLRHELLANVSHDFRTPLALIYSYAEMMHDFPAEITPEQTKTIMDETLRLTTLVNDVLDLSKLENEMEKLLYTEQLNFSHYNLTRDISELTVRMEKLLEKENYSITFSRQKDAFVHADKIKIDRAFYNLLINAVNYSGDSRNISVEQKFVNNYVRISVIDNGEGIAEADLPFIWDRYYKSSKPHKRAVTGSGMGLSIVKKIISLHNGKYGVESEAGKGSTFWFEIRLSE
jgi:signal transduction histidine kinase